MLSDEQQMIRENVLRLCQHFDDGYWLARDRDGEFPREFVAAFAAGGWIGTAMPEEYGGAGLGVTEAALAMQAVAESGAGMSGASAVHISIFAPRVIVKHGSEAQRRRFLPPLIEGRDICAFGVTEPDVGLDTTRITTFARRRGEGYVISGKKVWTSLAQVATRILLLARTTPLADC
ncbi:MAG TPA: acyl-CoA dehydrogenase family protein, partial [Dongiaceae bacterium]